MGCCGGGSAPAPTNPAQSYEQQVLTDLRYAPQQAAQELALRMQFEPQYAAHMLEMARTLGPQALEMYTQMFRNADPTRANLERDVGAAVTRDLAAGYEMTPEERRMVEGAARGAQAARGNNLGTSSAVAEATMTADRARQLYEDRLARAMAFQQAPGVVQQAQQAAGFVQGTTTPNNNFSFVNRNAGQQGQQAYANYDQLRLQQYQQAQANNPWAQAIGTAGGLVRLGGAIAAI